MKTSLGGLHIFSWTPLQCEGSEVTFTMEEGQVLVLGMRILLQTPNTTIGKLTEGGCAECRGRQLPANLEQNET